MPTADTAGDPIPTVAELLRTVDRLRTSPLPGHGPDHLVWTLRRSQDFWDVADPAAAG